LRVVRYYARDIHVICTLLKVLIEPAQSTGALLPRVALSLADLRKNLSALGGLIERLLHESESVIL